MAESLLERFKEAATSHGEKTSAGDYKKTNKAYDRMIAAVRAMRQLPDRGQAILESLLTDPDASVRSGAACYLLPLNERAAIPILEEVANSKNPLISLDAEMVLKEWRAGRLKLLT